MLHSELLIDRSRALHWRCLSVRRSFSDHALVVVLGLFPDELLQSLLREIVEFHLESERLFTHWLVSRIVVLLEIWVSQGLLNVDAKKRRIKIEWLDESLPIVWVECEHFVEQVESSRVSSRVETSPRLLRLMWQRDQVRAGLVVDNALEIFVRWRSDDGKDQVQLIEIMLPGEKRPVAEHLGENASDGPDVNRLSVSLRVEHDLRSTVPASGDVLGQESSVVGLRISDTSQSKVADL